MTTFRDFIVEELERDPEFRAAWDGDRTSRELIVALNVARKAAGLTQAELAERVGTKQPTIARLERGDQIPRVDTLARIAAATGVEFVIGADGSLVARQSVPTTENGGSAPGLRSRRSSRPRPERNGQPAAKAETGARRHVVGEQSPRLVPLEVDASSRA